MGYDNYVLAALLVVLGAGLLFNPYYLWPHHGDEAFAVSAHAVDEPQSEATPVSDLPPATADFVERVITRSASGETTAVDSRDSFPSQGLLWADTQPVVSRDGQTYRLDIDHLERSPPVFPEHWLLRVGMGFVGALSLTLGVLTASRGRPRMTPRSSWLVVIIWTAVVVGTIAYDGDPAGLGATAVFPGFGQTPIVGVVALILPAVGVVAGATIRSRGRDDWTALEPEMVVTVGFVAVTFLVSLPGAIVGWLLGTPPPSKEERPLGTAE